LKIDRLYSLELYIFRFSEENNVVLPAQITHHVVDIQAVVMKLLRWLPGSYYAVAKVFRVVVRTRVYLELKKWLLSIDEWEFE